MQTWVPSNWAVKWIRLDAEWIHSKWNVGLAHLCQGSGVRFASQAKLREGRWTCSTCMSALPEHLHFVLRVDETDYTWQVHKGYYTSPENIGGVFYQNNSAYKFQRVKPNGQWESEAGFWEW